MKRLTIALILSLTILTPLAYAQVDDDGRAEGRSKHVDECTDGACLPAIPSEPGFVQPPFAQQSMQRNLEVFGSSEFSEDGSRTGK